MNVQFSSLFYSLFTSLSPSFLFLPSFLPSSLLPYLDSLMWCYFIYETGDRFGSKLLREFTELGKSKWERPQDPGEESSVWNWQQWLPPAFHSMPFSHILIPISSSFRVSFLNPCTIDTAGQILHLCKWLSFIVGRVAAFLSFSHQRPVASPPPICDN